LETSCLGRASRHYYTPLPSFDLERLLVLAVVQRPCLVFMATSVSESELQLLPHWLSCIHAKRSTWTCSQDYARFVRLLRDISLELYVARNQPNVLVQLARYGSACTRVVNDLITVWSVPLLHESVSRAVIRFLVVCQTGSGPEQVKRRALAWARHLLRLAVSPAINATFIDEGLGSARVVDELCTVIGAMGCQARIPAELGVLIPSLIQGACCADLVAALVPTIAAMLESQATSPAWRHAVRCAFTWEDAETKYCAFRDGLSATLQNMLLAADAQLLCQCLQSPEALLKTPLDHLSERFDHIRLFLRLQHGADPDTKASADDVNRVSTQNQSGPDLATTPRAGTMT
jgi:hypothetical protein